MCDFQELFPAVHYIYCGEHRHNRMPFPSGLGVFGIRINLGLLKK